MAIRSPEGTFDLLPQDAVFWDYFRNTAFSIFGRYGYQPIETPMFEQTELLCAALARQPMWCLRKCLR